MSFQDESDKTLVLRRLDTSDLREWLDEQPACQGEYFIWHHTEEPTEKNWHGKSTLQGIFNYYRDSRGFPYGHGPQFWSAPDGIWIGHHPSVWNRVGAVGWNGYTLHMETVHNGNLSPYSEADLAMHAERARIICDWAGIPVKWLKIGSDGGATKAWSGIGFHRQLYINGSPPKTCPGTKIKQDVVLAAIQAAGGELSMADIDTILKRLDAMQADIDASQRADSHRGNILIAKLFGGDVEAAIAAAKKDGVALPNLDPQ